MSVHRLSGTDSLFLLGETPTWHQHVAGLTVLDPSERLGFGFETIFELVAARLPLIPKLTWKLKSVPLAIDRPIWVDDPAFDLHHHVHRLAVPAPGGPRETAAAIEPILSRQLDRDRPLWELWYLDGLVNGRVAMVMKMHHSMMDGGAGSVLATLLLDTEPDPPSPVTPSPSEPDAGPDTLRLLTLAATSFAATPLRSARYATRVARRGLELARHLAAGRPRPDLGAMLRAPKTSFNRSIGPRRAVAFSSVGLADMKEVAAHFDVKFNDVALALCAGALRRYLESTDELPARPLTAGVPVSLRAPGDASLDNQLSYLVVPLATDVADSGDRLRAIASQSSAAKSLHRTLREHPVGSIADTAPPFVLGAALRLAYESHVLAYVPGMMNTIVSNVPGPPMELYLGGARLTGIFSASVLLDQIGLNITLFTFGERVDFGLHVDPDLIGDPWMIAEGMWSELTALRRAAGLAEPTPIEDAFGLVSRPHPRPGRVTRPTGPTSTPLPA